MSEEHKGPHITSYKSHTIIWIILMIFTGLSVAATRVDVAPLAVLVAMIIATIKGLIVVMYFMHVKYENKLIQWIIVATFTVFASIVIGTYLDYIWR